MEPVDRNIKDSFDKYISLEKELKELEKEIYKLEIYYLDEASFSGTYLIKIILKGKFIERMGLVFDKERQQPITLISSL